MIKLFRKLTGHKKEAGFTLIAAVVLMVVIGFLGVVASFLLTSGTKTTTDYLSSARAFYIAEGGLEKGIFQYKANCSGYAGEANTALGGGTFTITLFTTDFSGNALTGQKRIRSTATIAGATRVVDQIATCGSAGKMRATGTINNGGTIDCSTSQTNCTNAQITAGTCTCAAQGVTGMPAVNVPSSLTSGSHGPTNDTGCSPINNYGYAYTWNAGTYYCSTLNINSNVTITLSGPVTLYVGTLSVNAGDLINTTGTDPAANLLVMVTTALNFNGSGTLDGYIYAPGLGLNVNGTLNGGISARSITMNGGSVFNSDSTAGSNCSNFNSLTGTGGGTNETWQEQ